MTGEEGRHDHLGMRFVQDLIYNGMVKTLIDLIRARVSEADEEGQLHKHDVTESKRGLERLLAADRTFCRSREEKQRKGPIVIENWETEPLICWWKMGNGSADGNITFSPTAILSEVLEVISVDVLLLPLPLSPHRMLAFFKVILHLDGGLELNACLHQGPPRSRAMDEATLRNQSIPNDEVRLLWYNVQ